MLSESMEKLRQLSELVENSAGHTHRQLQSIESSQLNLLISSIIAVVVALGVSVLFEILTYWVSSSFLLMYLWGLYSFFRAKRPKVSDLEKTSDSLQKLGKEKTNIGFEWFFANVSSLIKAIGVIYAITFTVLIFTGLYTSYRDGGIMCNQIISCLCEGVWQNYQLLKLARGLW